MPEPAGEILPAGFQCPHCQSGVEKLRKETDVLDVWFDSGSTNRAVLENHGALARTVLACRPVSGRRRSAPGLVQLVPDDRRRHEGPRALPRRRHERLDAGRERRGVQHKSKGNGVNPLDVIKNSGADVVRWWVVSQNFMEDTRCGENLLKQVGEMYRRVRNTFRFLVNNLYDFDPAVNAVADVRHGGTGSLGAGATGPAGAERHTAPMRSTSSSACIRLVLNFCATEMSSFYLDVIKDRLYADGADSHSRRSAQTAMHTIADTLARLLAPILVHTSEEVWDYLKAPNKAESVHLAAFPTANRTWTPFL